MPAIVSVDVRAPELFGSTTICTVPDPLPLPPDVMRAHPSGAVADHEHSPPVVTVTVVLPPASVKDAEVGFSEYEQPAFWCTAKLRPPTLMVASRAAPPFASTVNETVPGPEPLPPAVMCTHGCEAVAVQPQPAPVFTARDPAPPPEAND